MEQRKADDFTVVPEYDTLYTSCDFELCFWLSKFVHEIKKKDGSEYPPNTRYQIFAGLQRALRENGLPELDIFRNPRYKLFQDSMDSRIKTLTRPGLGVNVNQAKPISGDEEKILWSKGLLGEDDPRTLVNTLVYLFGKCFSLRSGEGHRERRFSQLEVIEGDLVERKRLKYTSFAEKNYVGGLQHRKGKAKVVEHHENIVNPERCVVRLYKKYVSKCPNDVIGSSVFYLNPKRKWSAVNEIWFTRSPIGKIFEICSY